ncbi:MULTISPECIES: hypothetical protein [Wolbachia]|jgi:hypothetical protein|uniref:GDSL family lipase n=5 Tax=unclassified Wolbachia TaxID=2640676 RepID=A0AAU8MMF5_9RICK|nr:MULTISPECIES: hypothetical protein [unclassified Wolbachia]MEC4734625.1 hypothetical protein [Wolbachia endosymbiont of Halictus tumulorum]OAM06470.1 MAG: hypothetical protein TV41_04480 [Wolbachia endosymbiont of Dactylopius coccus]AGJ99361.1 hypothetical protein wNo_09850 [Wolbachia endosymbiont of Drosophila simulans wNo]OAB80953.1 hypothetical protein WSTR_04965 [Wolbachia endosymbiont of Laodelphax striatellus]QCB62551.1 hypothetical protein EJA99_02790 [Wolbachia endosymbiont of Droso
MAEGFFSRYIGQPIKNFYNYVTGKKEVSDDMQNTANQESSELLETDVQSNDVPPSSDNII